jgi:hypothetical protein
MSEISAEVKRHQLRMQELLSKASGSVCQDGRASQITQAFWTIYAQSNDDIHGPVRSTPIATIMQSIQQLTCMKPALGASDMHNILSGEGVAMVSGKALGIIPKWTEKEIFARLRLLGAAKGKQLTVKRADGKKGKDRVRTNIMIADTHK